MTSELKPDICDSSLLDLYGRYKDAIDAVQSRESAIALGFEIMKDFREVMASRSCSAHLAALVSLNLPGGSLDYLDFYGSRPHGPGQGPNRRLALDAWAVVPLDPWPQASRLSASL